MKITSESSTKTIQYIHIILVIFLITVTSSGCAVFKTNDVVIESVPVTVNAGVEIDPEPEHINNESWFIPDAPRKLLRTLEWDLIHQKIWVRFNFPKKQVIGKTELFFVSESNNSLITLDSKTTEIIRILNLQSGQDLAFQQDSALIHINLGDTYNASDSLFISVEFVSTPPNRGLYFVNPTGEDPDKPTQIWTLGQPQDNSFWLPTIDHPAERATQETWISVPDNFTTISNGVFIDGKTLPGDSLRTDYWVLDKPHAPYLFALAVGEYDLTEQYVDGVVLKYYTEPDYTPYVESIYTRTDDMLRFFNSKFSIKYPWKTYSQVPVRDFIASGMENTTLTILFNNVQTTHRQSVDVEYQDLIAHELIHHWFGNLVTCKDWANLPLNEGFARYFESIYRRHATGDVSAEWNGVIDRQRYFQEASLYRRPLIFDRYTEPEDMYDRHTYEKAGLILRMLHEMVGEEQWWSALNRYLNDNAYSTVDWTQLRDAFSRETGLNMDGFFEKWFTGVGHPELNITYDYNAEYPSVNIKQTQNLQKSAVFEFPVEIHFTDDVNQEFVQVVYVTSVDTTITLPIPSHKIGEMLIDPYRIVVAEYTEPLVTNELVSRLAHPSVHLRQEAVEKIGEILDGNPHLMNDLYEFYIFEQHGPLRNLALATMGKHLTRDWNAFIHSINHETESYYQARITAASISAKLNGVAGNNYLNSLKSDPSYYVEQYIVSLFNQHLVE